MASTTTPLHQTTVDTACLDNRLPRVKYGARSVMWYGERIPLENLGVPEKSSLFTYKF